MGKTWGIDVEGRPMRYEPWPVDEDGRYREPTAEEAEVAYRVSGEAVAETFLYFEKEGGDANALVSLLNDHCVSSAYRADRSSLVDPSRRYGEEYYFYFIMFAKKAIGRYGFRFGEGSEARLGKHHRIYELGFQGIPPWGLREDGREIKGASIANIAILHRYLKLAGSGLEEDFVAFLEDSLDGRFDIRSSLGKETIWCSIRMVEFGFSLFRALADPRVPMAEAVEKAVIAQSVSLKSLFGISFMSVRKAMDRMASSTNHNYSFSYRRFGDGRIDLSLALKEDGLLEEYGQYYLSGRENDASVWEGGYRALIRFFFRPRGGILVRRAFDEGELGATIELSFSWASSIWKGGRSLPWTIAAIGSGLGAQCLLLALGLGSSALSLLPIALVGAYCLSLALERKKELEEADRQAEAAIAQIDEVQKANSELVGLHASLEGKVRERTAELARANEKLKSLDRAKTNFFYNVSHELRTPLTLIAAPLEEIAAGRYGARVDARDRVFQTMRRNCDRLKRQVTNLLDFGKVEQGKMAYEPRAVDLGRLVRLYAAELDSAARIKGLELRCEAGQGDGACFAMIDEGLFEKAFFNLASNAIKFTDRGGKVIVSLVASDGELRVTIADTGIGIAEGKLVDIFERFGQADDGSTRRYEGTGIGLSLTRELVALQGGRIEVESEPGIGSAFTIALPRAPAGPSVGSTEPAAEAAKRRSVLLADAVGEGLPLAAAPAATLGPARARGTGEGAEERPTILVVEDNEELLAFLRDSLERRFRVLCARDGEEALELLGGGILELDAILSDVMMPRMDGRELYERLRALEGYGELPFVFLTARASDEERVESLGRGAVDYICKPFSMPELEAKLASVTGLARGSRERARRDLEGRVLRALSGSGRGAASGAARRASEDKAARVLLEGYGLSEREKDVALLAADGLANKEIASRLGLSPQRVANVLSIVFRKAGASSRAELMRMLR